MGEARQLKAGRWRIYEGSGLEIVRDPQTGSIVTFDTLAAARRWWSRSHPDDPPLAEAKKCARCGAYFGPTTEWAVHDGRYFHPAHSPAVFTMHRGR